MRAEAAKLAIVASAVSSAALAIGCAASVAHERRKALAIIGSGRKIAGDEEQQRHEECLQKALVDAEDNFRGKPRRLAINIVPVAERAISIGRVHGEHEHDHRPADVVDVGKPRAARTLALSTLAVAPAVISVIPVSPPVREPIFYATFSAEPNSLASIAPLAAVGSAADGLWPLTAAPAEACVWRWQPAGVEAPVAWPAGSAQEAW